MQIMDYDVLGFAERPIAALLIVAGIATMVASAVRHWRQARAVAGD
jgi:hypothetical protein